jgi:hypothetical protein
VWQQWQNPSLDVYNKWCLQILLNVFKCKVTVFDRCYIFHTSWYKLANTFANLTPKHKSQSETTKFKIPTGSVIIIIQEPRWNQAPVRQDMEREHIGNGIVSYILTMEPSIKLLNSVFKTESPEWFIHLVKCRAFRLLLATVLWGNSTPLELTCWCSVYIRVKKRGEEVCSILNGFL